LTASNIQITAGSGTRLATNSYTESGVTVHDEKFIPGEYPYPTYVATAGNISIATTNDHLMTINAGSTLNVRIRRIRVRQRTVGTASTLVLQFLRTTTGAPSGGTAITPARYNTADSASGATAMTLPSTKGTESTVLWTESLGVYATAPAIPFLEWTQLQNSGPIVIAAGTTNGLAIKVLSGIATNTVDIDVEFIETSW
jgi:hypothetical protein